MNDHSSPPSEFANQHKIQYNTRDPVFILYYENTYIDRTADFPYKIDHNDLCYKLFMEHGFEWGGDWENAKDYQHFEVPDSVIEKMNK